MYSVIVQVWGPANAMFGGYDWIPAGMIETENIDMDFLRQKAVEIISSRDHMPFLNATRLKITKEDRTEMKVTMTDLW